MRGKFITGIALFFVAALPAFADGWTVDFGRCQPEKNSFGFGLGSLEYEVIGLSKHGCVLLFGREVENPRWDRALRTLCVVPREKGKITFPVSETGPKMDAIQAYCGATPGLRPAGE